MKAINDLKAVLCGPNEDCCIEGSDEDRKIINDSLKSIARLVDLVDSLCEDLTDGTFDKNNNRKEYLELLRKQII